MGIILPNFKKTVVDEFRNSITSNSSQYYVFAANPVATDSVENNTFDDYSSSFENDWKMIFGKKLTNTNIVPVIKRIDWSNNTPYTKYDNTKDVSTSNYYVITTPEEVGGYYHVYKCIDNANGANSTSKPDLVQLSSFTKSDGYIWRYIYSISPANYSKFASDEYIPVYPNNNIQDAAYGYSGIEVVSISNGGFGYSTYNDGVIKSVSNTTVLQISLNASSDNDFYTKSSMYIFNEIPTEAELKKIVAYTSNNSGKWVTIDTPANTTNIIPNVTQYYIRPTVQFNTDGDFAPMAYCTINSTSNSINSVVILEPGYGISRADVSIVSNTGSGANMYCIVPPPGGHGNNPEAELNMSALGVYFEFNGYESGTISIDTLYNKIGIIKNPHSLTANNTKGTAYSSSTFSQLLKANTGSAVSFTVGDTVTGNTSKSKGIVVFSNSAVVHLVGDKSFVDGEYIVSSDNLLSTTISINTLGDIYTKDIIPLYVRNIADVARANAQSEAFRLIIQV